MTPRERDAAIIAEAERQIPTKEIATRYGLKENRVQQIVRVAKLRARYAQQEA